MNRGDTICLMLDYQVNNEPLVEGAYEEIELQINNESASKSMKKTLTGGDIVWETVTYLNNGVEESFTGYVVHLTQSETFSLNAGQSEAQLRIKMNGEVGSSENSKIKLGAVLSSTVI